MAVLWAVPLSLFLPPLCCWGCRVLSAAVAHLGACVSPEVTSSCFSHANVTFGRGSVRVPMSPWSHRCAADRLPMHKGTKNLSLTLLQTQLPLDASNTLETMQTTSLLWPAQPPVSISIRRRSEFASGLRFF